ncbi:hypothetical protein C2E23DRAFT_815827 [Lenzites betulinus]|nr:hypothetical protein C2E23DRAFT_815827 [Lenzites betulinus]
MPALTVHLKPTLFVPGCLVEGEVELNFRALQDAKIEEVHVKLRGIAKTAITYDKTTLIEIISLARDDASLWSRGGAYPLPGEDSLRIPFRLQLPIDPLPPPFRQTRFGQIGKIGYAVTAVGVRPGALRLNQRVNAAFPLVPKDTAGVSVREKLALMAITGEGVDWRTEAKEEKIRRGLWGEYSTVRAELKIPRLATYPLFAPIPYVIKVKTISTPITREKAGAYPADKSVFPPCPEKYEAIQFKLRSHVFLKAHSFESKTSVDTMVFPRNAGSESPLTEDITARKWVPLEDSDEKKGSTSPDTKGTWVQEATFRSTFRLDCPTTFALSTIKCDHDLVVKVPFPGIKNDLILSVPIIVTSGIDAPLARDAPGAPMPSDLAPSYWDIGVDGDWDSDTKE